MKRTKYPYERATKAQRRVGALWACIHHNKKYEALLEPVADRVKHIRTKKPEHERETRLRAMRPCRDKALLAAHAEYARVYAIPRPVTSQDRLAWAEYDKVRAAAWDHECADVPWGLDGLVFPKAKEADRG